MFVVEGLSKTLRLVVISFAMAILEGTINRFIKKSLR